MRGSPHDDDDDNDDDDDAGVRDQNPGRQRGGLGASVSPEPRAGTNPGF